MINEKRIHGLDALRAVAMLLGVLLHATIAYRKENAWYWVHDNQYNSLVFDFLYFFIHSFRMPLFFMVAGFFCRFLYYRSGEKAFIEKRWKRIGLPFLVGMVTIVPMTMFPFSLYEFVYRQHLSWDEAYKKSFSKLFVRNGVAHLWFLYDLLMYYVVVIVVMRAKKITFIENAVRKITVWWDRIHLDRLYWIVLFSFPVWIILIREKELFVLADFEIIPEHFSYIFFYGFFFIVGWFFQRKIEVFNILIKNAVILSCVGLFICVILFCAEQNDQLIQNQVLRLICKLAAAFQVVFFTGGITGLFLRYFNNESRLWRYLSDASYWVYLVHMGMVFSLQMFFLDSSVPGILRFTLVLCIPLIVSFLTYQWFVRYTFIGNVLNGPRKRKEIVDNK
jgi:glucan biosynthesis protein C